MNRNENDVYTSRRSLRGMGILLALILSAAAFLSFRSPRLTSEYGVLVEVEEFYPKKKTTLPTILLAGAQKSGTSALSTWLTSPNSENNGVCQAAMYDGTGDLYRKEVHFFASQKNYQKGLEFYEQHFQHCFKDNTTTTNIDGIDMSIDPSVNTMRHAQRVFDTYQRADQLSTLKIIFSLREPISRDISYYNMLKSAENTSNPYGFSLEKVKGSYDEYANETVIPALEEKTRISSIKHGLYAQHLETWFQLFPRRQILILSYDEILNDPAKARHRVELFLGQSFPVGDNNNNWKHVYTNGYAEKVVQPSCSTQQHLARLFEPHNERLYKLLESTTDRPSMEQQPFPHFRLGDCLG